MNKVSVYIVRLDPSDYSEAAIQSLLRLIPRPDRLRYTAFSNHLRQQQSLTGEVLARYAVSRYAGLPAGQISIGFTEKGKPYLDGDHRVHFNISHSGDYVVCAVSRAETGIDVERIRKVKAGISGRYFAPAENQAIQSLPEPERDAFFITLWTIKESFLKATGEGIADQLDTFSAERSGEGFRLAGNRLAEQFGVQFMHLPGNFTLSVCTRNPFTVSNIRYLSLSSLLNGFAPENNSENS